MSTTTNQTPVDVPPTDLPASFFYVGIVVEDIEQAMRKAFEDSDGTYGYRRVAAQLARWGVRVGPELVRALMRELGLVACQPHPWRPTTTQQGDTGPIPDLVGRDFTAVIPGEKMVGGITYIPTWELVAADGVIGDHGSITTYAAALGRPVLQPTWHVAQFGGAGWCQADVKGCVEQKIGSGVPV